MVEELENKSGHFTHGAVLQYLAKSLPAHQRLEMAVHFGQCGFCRGKLRELAAHREHDILRSFASGILDVDQKGREAEAAAGDAQAKKKALAQKIIHAVQASRSKGYGSTRQIISSRVSGAIYGSRPALALLLLLFAAVALVGAVIIFNYSSAPVQTNLTATVDAIVNKNTSEENSSHRRSPDKQETETPQTTVNRLPPPAAGPKLAIAKMPNRNLNTHKTSNKRQTHSGEPASRNDLGNRQTLPKTPEVALASGNKNDEREAATAISNYRGTNKGSICGERKFETHIEWSPETVKFRWIKLAQAVNYHLYVSDDSQILVEEFETETETSYVLKKQLEAGKTYKWKIVATLKGGQKFFGETTSFIAGQKLRKYSPPKKEIVRCTQ